MADIDIDELERERSGRVCRLCGNASLSAWKGCCRVGCPTDPPVASDPAILSLIALVRAGKENERKAWIAGRDAAAEKLASGLGSDWVSNHTINRVRRLTPPPETSP